MRVGALGLLEVLGSASGIIAADKMLKTSDVSILGRNYKCGGHVTTFICGDVSAVTAAIETAKSSMPCEVFGAAVISNPSEEIMRVVMENKK